MRWQGVSERRLAGLGIVTYWGDNTVFAPDPRIAAGGGRESLEKRRYLDLVR